MFEGEEVGGAKYWCWKYVLLGKLHYALVLLW